MQTSGIGLGANSNFINNANIPQMAESVWLQMEAVAVVTGTQVQTQEKFYQNTVNIGRNETSVQMILRFNNVYAVTEMVQQRRS